MRPSLALGLDPLTELRVVDLGDVEMPSGETERSLGLLEDRVAMVARHNVIPIILGGDHTIALPDVTGVAHHLGFRTSVRDPLRRPRRHRRHANWAPLRARHADAPTDRVRARAEVIGSSRSVCAATGPSPRPWTGWPSRGMRSFEMSEIVARGLDDVLSEVAGSRYGRLRRGLSFH